MICTRKMRHTDALDLVSPSSAELHEVFDREHAASTGLHNLRVVELTYQVTLEVGGDILLAAASNVGFETESSHEKYVSSALTGVDWVKGKNAYSGRFKASEEHAHAAVPNLQDGLSRKRAGSHSHIETGLDPCLLMAVREFDTIGTAYMCSDGAVTEQPIWTTPGWTLWSDPHSSNDVMDLHIVTAETRNLLRRASGCSIPMPETSARRLEPWPPSSPACSASSASPSAAISGPGSHGREDGRIAATSPPYSFCRARHGRIFETLGGV
ncbi:hypothetical protein C2857_007871 [Epichloe festucae Fl1]|uniref:Uncharacterized protein n=1 Tax=Epichloe festucae (strain Fl1) TaxID=877507 RepID=A0A7S9KMV1_EPIFF|nr:hypothetical protein C2857_007871 [Epichloe festucae Fl1]